jgi:hypothetical protein
MVVGGHRFSGCCEGGLERGDFEVLDSQDPNPRQ